MHLNLSQINLFLKILNMKMLTNKLHGTYLFMTVKTALKFIVAILILWYVECFLEKIQGIRVNFYAPGLMARRNKKYPNIQKYLQLCTYTPGLIFSRAKNRRQ